MTASLSDPNAIHAIEENGAEFLLALGRAGGGEERDAGGVHWTIGGSPIAYHNAVVRCDVPADAADAAIAASIERLHALGLRGSWHVGPSMRPPDLPARLEAHGFTGLDAVEPGMAVDLAAVPGNVPCPADLAVEQVRDATQLEQFRRVLAAGFGEGEPEANWVCETYARIGLGDDTAWRHYLGRIGEVPVSTTSIFFAAGVAGVYFVCTAPDQRRRGIGAATALAALHAARDEGYRRAVLTSSPVGYHVYRQLGFVEHCRIAVPEYDPAAAPKGQA